MFYYIGRPAPLSSIGHEVTDIAVDVPLLQ